MQIYGYVEICIDGEWSEVINVSSILLDHSDLNGCLFGVDNYAGYRPLFAQRGFPDDLSEQVNDKLRSLRIDSDESKATWASFRELNHIDWSEAATAYDKRITEYSLDEGVEARITKWLQHPRLDWVRKKLDQDPATEIRTENRVFRRGVLSRMDSLTDTDFPLLMELMRCLARRFGEEFVRLVVWFG